MAYHTNIVVGQFDFSEAQSLTVDQRISRSLELARRIVAENGYQTFSEFPCVPSTGASDHEIAQLEAGLCTRLPDEYRQFLSRCRYLKIDDCTEVGGMGYEGLQVTESPWVSDVHRPLVQYLVFANYWHFADGDQLMFDLSDPEHPVIAYLHEHGPLYEFYAPSFSMALWRLVHEA